MKIAQEKENPSGGLYARIEIAVGMKGMKLLNVATEADIPNGTTGTIEEIFLHPRETKKSRAVEQGTVSAGTHPILNK